MVVVALLALLLLLALVAIGLLGRSHPAPRAGGPSAAEGGRGPPPGGGAPPAGARRPAAAGAAPARGAAAPKPRAASPTAALADALALTGDHALGAAELAEAVAKRMGLSAIERAHVRLASQLSGLGKLALPDALLGKAGGPSAEGRAHLRAPPALPERLLP